MCKYLLCFLVVAVGGCSSLHEGEHVNIAGVDFEGMAWPVTCDSDTPEELLERWEYENPNACAANLTTDETYSMCEEWMRVRYRFEWAKAEYRDRCEGRS